MMLKCNGEQLYESELCVKGERIPAKTTPRNHHHHHHTVGRPKQTQEEVRTAVSQREQPTRGCQRKTLHPNVVGSFSEQICGDLLKTIRKSAEVDDFKRYFLQANVELKNSDELNRKYSQTYHEFFGVHYEHLKSLAVK